MVWNEIFVQFYWFSQFLAYVIANTKNFCSILTSFEFWKFQSQNTKSVAKDKKFNITVIYWKLNFIRHNAFALHCLPGMSETQFFGNLILFMSRFIHLAFVFSPFMSRFIHRSFGSVPPKFCLVSFTTRNIIYSCRVSFKALKLP